MIGARKSGRFVASAPLVPRAFPALLRALSLALVLAVLPALPSCGPSQDGTGTPTSEATRQTEPLRITMEVSSESLRTVDTLGVTIRASALPDWMIEDQPAGSIKEQLETAGWHVDSVVVEPPALNNEGGLTRVYRFRLEPDLDGTYTLPPIGFVARDRSGEQTVSHATDERTIEVTSVLDESEIKAIEEAQDTPTAAQLVQTELRDTTIPVPVAWYVWAVTGGAALALVVLVGVVVLLVIKRNPRSPDRIGPALRSLEASAKGETDEPIGTAAKGLRTIVGELTGTQGEALSPDEAGEAVSGFASAQTARNTRALLDRLDNARFAGPGRDTRTPDLAAEALETARQLIAEGREHGDV